MAIGTIYDTSQGRTLADVYDPMKNELAREQSQLTAFEMQRRQFEMQKQIQAAQEAERQKAGLAEGMGLLTAPQETFIPAPQGQSMGQGLMGQGLIPARTEVTRSPFIDENNQLDIGAFLTSKIGSAWSKKYPELAYQFMDKAGLIGGGTAGEGQMTIQSQGDIDLIKSRANTPAAKMTANNLEIGDTVKFKGKGQKISTVDIQKESTEATWVRNKTKELQEANPTWNRDKAKAEAAKLYKEEVTTAPRKELEREKQLRDEDTAESIYAGIVAGTQSPEIGRGSGIPPAVAEKIMKLARKDGFSLRNAQLDFGAQKRYIATLNSPAQVRLKQAVSFAKESLGIIKDLGSQWKGGRYPKLNKANLKLAMEGVYGEAAQSLATRLNTQIVEMQSELATVYKGGGTPTDIGLQQAEHILKSEWSEKTLMDSIDLLDRNLKIRLSSMDRIGVADSSKTTPKPPEPEPTAPPKMKDVDIQKAVDKY